MTRPLLGARRHPRHLGRPGRPGRPGRSRFARRPRPAPGAVLAGMLALGALTGCGAGQNAVTLRPYAAADGLQAQKGNIRVINALVVTGKDGTGALSLSIANLGNAGSAGLRGIDVAGKAAKLSGGAGAIGPGEVLGVGTGSSIGVALAGGGLKAGTYVPLVLHFDGALGDLAMNATVVAADYYYATVGPSAAPSAG